MIGRPFNESVFGEGKILVPVVSPATLTSSDFSADVQGLPVHSARNALEIGKITDIGAQNVPTIGDVVVFSDREQMLKSLF